jgi:eukaryotic-like serine/threonine-protein kinase
MSSKDKVFMTVEGSTKGIQKIGRYRVTGELGRGGMGIVYRGEDRLIGRRVAIKTLTEVTPELRERFHIEARSGILSHQNIVTVYEVGEHEGSPFIAMEFIEGDSLEKVLRLRKRLPLLEALSIVEQVCAGLGYAHGHGVVHRDVKPANILVRPDGRVTIVDFGIARLADQSQKLTKTDALLGTFHYIAPERLKGEPSDGRADIWSVGVMLYEMLTGELPFKGSDVSSLYRVIHEPYVPLATYVQDLPDGLSRVLDKALAKQVDARYATAEEMAFDLQALGEGLKHERIGALLETARRLSEESQHASARTVLLQAQRIDPSNTETKTLLGDVQEHLRHMQRSEQLRQISEQAQDATSGRRWDDAIELFEQARKLDSENAFNLDERLQHAQREKALQERVLALWKQADDARNRGDLTKAQDYLGQALQVDNRNTDLRNAYSDVLREVKGKQQQFHMEDLSRTQDEAGTAQKSGRHGEASTVAAMEEANELLLTARFTRVIDRHEPLASANSDAAVTRLLEKLPSKQDEAEKQSSLSGQFTEVVVKVPDEATRPPQEQSGEIRASKDGVNAEAQRHRATEIRAAVEKAVAACDKAITAGKLDQCMRPLDDLAKQYGASAALASAIEECESKRRHKATQVLLDALQAAQRQLKNSSARKAEELLKGVEYALPFAGVDVRSEWRRLKNECTAALSAKQPIPKSSATAKRGKPWWYVAASTVVVAAIAVAGLAHHRHEVPVPHDAAATHATASVPPPPPTTSMPTDLEINASPWAKVVSVQDEAGNSIALPDEDQTTPLRLEGINSGTYKVTFARADGKEQTVECNVSAGEHLCAADLGSPDPEHVLIGEQP